MEKRQQQSAWRAAGVLAFALAAASSAIAQHSAGQHAQATTGAASGMSMEMHQSMKEGMDKMMSVPSTGDTDRDFASMMKMHHQMAIDMAKAELDKGKSPEMKQLAQQIIKDSQRDIQKIEQWMGQKKP